MAKFNVPILDRKRVRKIKGGFSFIPHSFLTEGFIKTLRLTELALYFFHVLASDRYGISYYSDESLLLILEINQDQLDDSRNSLIEKDLILYEFPFTQVLELPARPIKPIKDFQAERKINPASLILKSLQGE